MTHSTHKCKSVNTGKGFVNSLINSLPFEAHIPGYQYCGPGTKLKKRLDRGDKGINPLDSACRDHDIVYATSKNLDDRHKADKVLENRAWERYLFKDTLRKEKFVAYAVANAMKAKRKLGMGCKRKRSIKTNGILAAKKKRNLKKKNGGKRLILEPRQSGGVIPLIPIFAGLLTLGSLMSGGASVYNAVQNSKRKKELSLNDGCYEIEDINNAIAKMLSDVNNESGSQLTFSVRMNPVYFRTYIKCNGILCFDTPYSIAPVLGFKEINCEPFHEDHRSDKAVNLNTINSIKDNNRRATRANERVDVDEYNALLKLWQQQDEEFMTYTTNLITKYKKAGISVIPLIKAIALTGHCVYRLCIYKFIINRVVCARVHNSEKENQPVNNRNYGRRIEGSHILDNNNADLSAVTNEQYLFLYETKGSTFYILTRTLENRRQSPSLDLNH
ncbi:hypothetical protein QTP88_017660 [Uroleucon formosanum]